MGLPVVVQVGLASAAGFASFRLLLGRFAKVNAGTFFPASVRGQPLKENRWLNILVSLLHSCISALGCILCLLGVQSTSGWGDLVNFGDSSFYPQLLMSFCCGYFIYDGIDLTLHNLNTVGLILHHVLIAGFFLLSISLKKYTLFMFPGLISELNSVLLHSRTLMKMASMNASSFIYRLNHLLLVITLLLTRTAVHGWILWRVFTDWHLFPDGGAWQPLLAATGMLVMHAINFQLLWSLCSAEGALLWPTPNHRGEKKNDNKNTHEAFLEVNLKRKEE
ncbi:TLC domain-containing protein 2 [Balamuthia mandrillaris]